MTSEYLFNIEKNWRNFGGIVVASGTLALTLAGCGGNGERNAKSTQPQTETTQPANTGEELPTEGVTIAFDSLGSDLDKGGSNVIQVYAGPEDTSTDKEATGTYMDGQSAEADCKVEGREVSSHPEQGELERSSEDWLRLDQPSGEEMWATAVYIENPQEVLGQLEDC